MTFELNREGGAEVLKEMARAHINALAQQIAEASGGEVHESTTDRAKATVTVSAGRQVKDGALTRAASAAGLEVRAK